MDAITVVQVLIVVVSWVIPSTTKFAAFLSTWLLVRWMVRIKAKEQDSQSQTKSSLLMPKSIWPAVPIVILVVDIATILIELGYEQLFSRLLNLFSLPWVDTVKTQFSGILEAVRASRGASILEMIFSILAPWGSFLLGLVKEQPEYFLVLFMFLVLECSIHSELRMALKKALHFTEKSKGKRSAKSDKREEQREVHAENVYNELYEERDKTQWYFLKEEHKWRRVLYQIALWVLLAVFFALQEEKFMILLLIPLYVVTEFWMDVAVPTRRELFEQRQKQDGSHVVQDEFNDVISKLGQKLSSKIQPIKYTAPRSAPKNLEPAGEQTHEENLVQRYLDLCREAGESIDLTLAEPAKALLRGRSVVFSTRFYQDMDYGFCLPMLRVLQSGYRCLIVCGDQINLEPVEDWLLSGRRYLVGDTDIWKMHRVGVPDLSHQPNIGYMQAEDLGNTKLMSENSSFFSQVQLVLIINASALLHKQLFGLVRLRRSLHHSCAFAICNDNAEGLTDIYAQLLQVELEFVYPTPQGAKQSYFVHFDEEKMLGGELLDCQQLELSKQLLMQCKSDLGTEIISKVRWYSKDSVPIKDLATLYGILRSADEYDSSDTQAGRLIFGLDDANCPRDEVSCVIVEDEIYNPAELVIQFASRGRLGSLVAVFSPYYLLRDFIRSHQREFYEHRRKIIQTFPAYCMSERNAVLQMVWNMLEDRLDERDIVTICTLLGQSKLENRLKRQGHVDKQALAQVFQMYTGCTNIEYHLHYEHKLVDGETLYEFWLDGISDKYYDQKRPCYCTCASFGGQRHLLTQYSRIQLQQCFLPGQLVSIAGRCYEVQSIQEAGDAMELSLRRDAQCAQLRLRFRQKRCIEIVDASGTGVCLERAFPMNQMTLCITQLTAKELTVNTVGSWMILGGKTDLYTPFSGGSEFQHRFAQKDLLCVEFSPSEPNVNCCEVAQCLMFELSELFRTIYVEYEHQLLVCKIASEEGGRIQVENFGQDEQSQPAYEYCRFYIIEDSVEDIGLLDSIRMHIDRLLRIILELEKAGKEEHGKASEK